MVLTRLTQIKKEDVFLVKTSSLNLSFKLF